MSLETSSPSNPANPFPLFKLPYEQLDIISEYAYDEDKRPKPICRDLRQFAEKRCFRDVRLTTYEALGSFAATMNSGAHLRCMVKTVSVSVPARRLNSRNRSSVNIGVRRPALADIERIVSRIEWATLLRRLPNIYALDLSNVDPGLLEILVVVELESPALRKLRKLVLRYNESPVLNKPWWPGQLAQYPALDDIELMWFQAFPAEIATPSRMPLLNIITLSLSSGDFEVWPAQNYAALFQNLQRLTMKDMDSNGFGSILATVPATIRFLAFFPSYIDAPEPEPAFPIDNYLRRFNQLEELHLCQDSFIAAGLATYLRTVVTLRVLSFDLWSPVTDDFLLSLVDGPMRLRQLKRLVLSYVVCERGAVITSDYTLPLRAGYVDDDVHSDWCAPQWPEDCSEAGLAAVVEAAEAAGVEVVETALDAVGYEEEWNRQMGKTLLVWGRQEADFDEARMFFGYDLYREGRRFFGDHEWHRLLREERV